MHGKLIPSILSLFTGIASCMAADPMSLVPPREQVILSSMFTDHMVLQRDRPVPVWGSAPPGQDISVTFAGQTKSARADDDGRWMVTLDPMPASNEPRVLRIGAQIRNSKLEIRNVVIGDVWICSGQSNMELALKGTENGEAVAREANHPLIRLYDVPHLSAAEPQVRCGAKWTTCEPATARSFSGVAYYFGRDIQVSQAVPVGLIHTAWSGACAESFVPEEALAGHPDLGDLVKAWRAYVESYPEQLHEYEAARKAWEAGGKEGRRPRRPKAPHGPEKSVGRLYNGMLHPLIPYAIRGVCWYQGENNILAVEQYRILFPFLIRTWRALWGQGDFPFLFVQIANFGAVPEQPEDSIWAHLRDAQMSGLSEPHTDMVAAIDIGGSFHPKNKRDVGLRLAAVARARVYGEDDLVASGPRLAEARFQGGTATMTFSHTGSGLATRDGEPLRGFALAGSDKRFVWADARIEGNKVIVSAVGVPAPAAVRYGWETNPVGNLINREGWPAFPFRTDDWPATKGL